MRLKRLLLNSLIPAAVVLFLVAGSVHAGEREVRILFTNNSNAKLTNCHCRNDSSGGLAERVGFIRRYRAEHPNVLLFDSGGYLGLSNVEDTGPVVFKLMAVMEYDAVGVGDQELYHTLETFLGLFGGYRDMMVSASVMNSGGESVFGRVKRFTANGVAVGVTGVVSDDTFRFFPHERKDFSYEPVDEALDAVMPDLDECAVVVVLSQMGYEADRELAAARGDIDLIIGGHSQTLLTDADVVGSCIIVQAGKRGGRVGEVVLMVDDDGVVSDFSYRLIELTPDMAIPDDIEPIVAPFR